MGWDTPWAEAESHGALPAHFRRIPVTVDPKLAAALVHARRRFPGAPAARILRELALEGAEALERERWPRATLMRFLASVHELLTSG